MRKVEYNTVANEALEQLSAGAFLTTKYKGEVNTMTIAWGNIGFMWQKPIFTVMVRPSRHTYKMIDHSESFTVSLPVDNDMKQALGYCGSKSGKDIDKIKELGLTLLEGQSVDTPIIGECSLHFECKIVAKQELKPECVSSDIEERAYNTGDLHTLFYGEIVECYKMN